MKKTLPETAGCLLLVLCSLFCAACSFDYGNQEGADSNQPDIVMDDVEYMRVRSGDPVARFRAENAQRFEQRQLMELRNFTFEQFEKQTGEVNANGSAGSAEVLIDSGDIIMDNGVRLEVESEDIIIETRQLEWRDKEKALLGGSEEAVNILRENGTSFSGVGFAANARRRTWEFSGGVDGTYIHDDEEEEAGDSETGDETAADGGGAESAESESAPVEAAAEIPAEDPPADTAESDNP